MSTRLPSIIAESSVAILERPSRPGDMRAKQGHAPNMICDAKALQCGLIDP
jgi:hypothetical protein